MERNHLYNKNLQPFAHSLRHRMTKAECCLWKYALRAGKMKGYTFRRQRPVLGFIADFLCLPLKIVIEVDGITHEAPEVQKNDEYKTQTLEAAGFCVLRFSDDAVLKSLEDVILCIEKAIEQRASSAILF